MPKMTIKAKLIENVRSEVDNSRGHTITCDLPAPAGGTNSGPTALELALMALADCGVTIFADVCKKSNIDPGKVEVVVEAEKTPDSPIITGVTMNVNITSKARKELVEAAWRRTEANCPVLFIYKEPMKVNVQVQTNTE
jgi:putative redox protein